MPTLDYVKQVAPELNDLDDANIQFWMDQASLFVAPGPWGKKYNLGVALLTAHYALSNQEGAVNSAVEPAVQSEKNGDLQRTYFSTGTIGVTDEFAGTSYGIWFYNLRKSIVSTPLLIG